MRQISGNCIASDIISFNGGTVAQIPLTGLKTKASRVLLQFYTDSAGVTAITTAAMAYTPIVVITENGDTPVAGFAGTKGFGLYHMAIYEVNGYANISNTKFVAFASGYTVYCKISYYK